MMQAVTQMSTPSALSDVRILDFSRVLAGPFATMMLADLGATVTKGERPGTGDETRSWGPPQAAAGGGGREPQKGGVALVDVLAGLFATVGILAALRHRDATGEGQRVDVDLFSALLAALVNQGSAFTIAGAVPGRLGNSHPSIAPYELLATREGELVVAVGNDRQFAALCEVLGLGALAADGRYAHNSDRVANRAQLRADLEVRLSDRPAADWARELTAVRVPSGVVNDVGAAFGLAQSLGLEPIVSLAKDDGGTVSLTRNPIRLSRTPPTYRSAPPSLPQR